MTCGEQLCAIGLSKFPQFSEFDISVAKNTRVRRPAVLILTAEIIDDLLKIFAEVQHVQS
jgi:hypothetical protein